MQHLRDRAADLHNRGHLEAAKEIYQSILKLQPANLWALQLLATLCGQQGRYNEALSVLERAQLLHPESTEVRSIRGTVFRELQRYDAAIENYNQALALKPNDPEILLYRAVLFQQMGRFEEAITDYDVVLSYIPGHFEAINNRAAALMALRRFDEALATLRKAPIIRPHPVEELDNIGVCLRELNRLEEAVKSFDEAVTRYPSDRGLLINRGLTLMAQSLPAAAIEDYTAALRFSDSCSDAHCYRANAYLELGELAKARADFEVALSLQADHPYALGGLANVALKLCDWDLVNKISGKLDKHVMAGKIQPGVLLGYTDDPDLINRCAKKHVEQRASSRVNNAAPSSPFSYHDKIRVAYLSPDFNRHATAYLIAELIELHDRSRFEITGISFGRNDDSHIRNRIASGFDSFHDMRCRCDSEVVALLHEKEIDIAVDLCGHMQNNRFRIFSYRPCPIQVSFLGYPGTTGANYIDYIIADKVVAPLAHQRHFSEKIVQLPRSYQVNDTTRKPKGGDISRDSVGLPEDKFVFCCFNGNWKITRPIFEIWMRLLKKLPHSVLWLLADNSYSQKALETAAAQNGIGAGRLVFSRRTSIDCHLMRHRLADLYLDTTPYGAHTAANDALRMGLPILTMLGSAFQSRVAASLLMAARLPELVTNDLSEYERLAFVLAKEPERLAGVKARCAKVVESPLFDGHLFRRDIESAFRKMWNIWRLGQKPVSFSVD